MAPLARNGDPAGWDELVAWTKRFADWDGLARTEDDYKLRLAERLRSARTAVLAQAPDWPDLLRQALINSDNNLVHFTVSQRFLRWCASEPARARPALLGLWGKTGSSQALLGAFDHLVPNTILKGAEVLSLGSVLLMAVDARAFPPCQRTVFERAFRLTRFPLPPKDSEIARLYGEALSFLDVYRAEAERRDLPIPHRLRAQGLLWAVLHWRLEQDPIVGWADADQQALARYRTRGQQ